MNSMKDSQENLANIQFIKRDNELPYFLISQEKLHSFHIDLLNEDYYVTCHDDENIIIKGSMLNQKDYEVIEEPNTLYFRRNDKHTIVHSPYEDEEKITITIPTNLLLRAFSFSAKSGEGTISKIDADQISISNISGEMTLLDMESSNLKVETMSGDIEVKNITSSNAEFITMTGDIELSTINIKNALRCNSLEGDIDLENGFAQEFFFKTESGDFDGKEFYPNTISFESISGDLDIKNKKTKHDIIIKSKTSIEGEINLK